MIARLAIFLSAFPYNVTRTISAKRVPIPLNPRQAGFLLKPQMAFTKA